MSRAYLRKRRRNPEQIRELLGRYDQSDLSQAEFAAQEGICLATLQRYRKSLPSSGGEKTLGQFIEVERSQLGLNLGRRELYRVCLDDGVCLEIPPGFSPNEVASLLGLISRSQAQ